MLLACATTPATPAERARGLCVAEARFQCSAIPLDSSAFGRCMQKIERACMAERDFAWIRGKGYVDVRRTDADIARELERAEPKP